MCIMKKSLLAILFILFTYLTFGQESLNVFDIARKGTVEQAIAIFKENPNAFKTLDKNGFTSLILACYRGNNEVARFLIENDYQINDNTEMGSALMACIVKENNEIAKLLIDKKADLNSTNNQGITALMYAVQFNNIEIIKLLLANNANKNLKDKSGKTAFEYATFTGNDEIINILK